MKIIYSLVVLTLLCFACVSETLAQNVVSYTYDVTGNRIKRTIVLTAQTEQSVKADSISKTQVFKENLGEEKILIYPNPTRGQLLVEISGYEKEATSGLYLYNLSGTLLFSKSPIAGSDLLDMKSFMQEIFL